MMQIIFFNINHARTDQKGIRDFIIKHKPKTSIFCLQEASDVGTPLLDNLLPNFKKITAYKYVSAPDTFHLATYVKNNEKVREQKCLMEDSPHLAGAVYTKVECNNKPIHILNFHGLSRPTDKLDSIERLEGSKNIISFFDNLHGSKIIGGDFNLFPETKSIKMFEEAGYINLIEQWGIKSTRNEVVWKLFPNSKQYFSDYVFVNKEVKVESFEVPYCEISDHLPMILSLDENYL